MVWLVEATLGGYEGRKWPSRFPWPGTMQCLWRPEASICGLSSLAVASQLSAGVWCGNTASCGRCRAAVAAQCSQLCGGGHVAWLRVVASLFLV